MSTKERIAENTIIVIKNMFEGNVGQLEDCFGISSIEGLLGFCQNMKTTYELYHVGSWVPTVPGEGRYYGCWGNIKDDRKGYGEVWVDFSGEVRLLGKDKIITDLFIAWFNFPDCSFTRNKPE